MPRGMPPTLVLFDIDGTLVDAGGAGRRGIERAFSRVFRIEDVSAPSSRVRFDGKTDPVIIHDIAREAGIDEETIRRRMPDLLDAYVEGLRDEMSRPNPRRRVMPGVMPLVETLHRRPGAHLGLLTGNIERGARVKLEPFGLNAYFPEGGFASDHPDRAEIARLAREKVSRSAGTSFSPSRVWVIGDTELDVACAHANGFRSLAVESGWVPREHLVASGPDALFADLTDVSAVIATLGV